MLSIVTRILSRHSLGLPSLHLRRCLTTSGDPLTICTQENGIRRITLNNPKTRNALSLALMESFKENLMKDVKDHDLRVIVISGNGPVFCAGHDLKELLSKKTRSDHAHIFRMCSDIMELIQDIPVPVICEVGALATAAGCQLVASCDVAIASDQAKFCTPGVNIGLFCSTPAVALARSVPRKLALEMLFTGEIISADRALAHGLVSRVVKHEDLQNEVTKMAETIIRSSRSVLALGKSTFYRQVVKDRHSAYQDASNIMVENLSLHDGREGISAFLEKRKAEWDHSLD
ncbi:enoyl-CoA hydratase domain-containing protein 3, mitochondrial-like [Clavelina lepadiformis]|uniref:enoyl-CoA hydratase domain-containing protein 3, mitochondrial-like n=1 Tax=Clavelina lepadiformis TaxID=159417 RepID=UPI00404278C6